MKLKYQYDKEILTISEKQSESDIEITILFKNEESAKHLEAIRIFFDENDIYTDAIFNTYTDNSHQVIVRKDYYIDFILQLFKQTLLKSITWE